VRDQGSNSYAMGKRSGFLPGQESRTGWRWAAILAAAMIGWMLVVIVLALATAPAGFDAQALQVGDGVAVTPPFGWVSAEDSWDVGPNGVSLEKSGALVAFAAETFVGDAAALLESQVAQIEAEFSSFDELPAVSDLVAGDVPALRVLFSGTANAGRLEGQVVSAVSAGTGIVMVAIAPAGQLRRVQGDIDTMLETMVVPR